MRLAQEKSLFAPVFYNLSDFSDRPQKRVDDAVYGGGAGQLLQVEPVYKAVQSIQTQSPDAKLVYLGPAGEPLTQSLCEDLAENM